MGDIHSVNYNDQQRQMLVQSHGNPINKQSGQQRDFISIRSFQVQ